MRRIKFAWLPTKLIAGDGWTWMRFYKSYRSDDRTINFRMVPPKSYDRGERREYEAGDFVGGYRNDHQDVRHALSHGDGIAKHASR